MDGEVQESKSEQGGQIWNSGPVRWRSCICLLTNYESRLQIRRLDCIGEQALLDLCYGYILD